MQLFVLQLVSVVIALQGDVFQQCMAMRAPMGLFASILSVGLGLPALVTIPIGGGIYGLNYDYCAGLTLEQFWERYLNAGYGGGPTGPNTCGRVRCHLEQNINESLPTSHSRMRK